MSEKKDKQFGNHKFKVKAGDITVLENNVNISKKREMSILGNQATISYGKNKEMKARIYGFDVRIDLESKNPNRQNMQFKIKRDEIVYILIDAIEKRYGKKLDEIAAGEEPPLK